MTTTFTIWSTAASGVEQPRQVPINLGNPHSPRATADGTLVFGLFGDDTDSLWSVRQDGGGLRQITPPTLWAEEFRVLPESNALVFRGFGADKVSHLWRVDADGGNLVQLTRGGGERLLDLSQDGRECLFRESKGDLDELWRLPLDGKTAPVRVARLRSETTATFSPDGRLVAQTSWENHDGAWRQVLAVLPREGGEPVATLQLGGNRRGPAWAEDASAVAYVTNEGGTESMMRWPITGGAATRLFRFPHGRIESFRWSRNTRTVLFAARVGEATNLWTWSVGAAEPRQLTRFPSGFIGAYTLSPDGTTVHFNQGSAMNDIVLIRGIK